MVSTFETREVRSNKKHCDDGKHKIAHVQILSSPSGRSRFTKRAPHQFAAMGHFRLQRSVKDTRR